MSSLFSRRGTTGYRWPKVCRTVRPPEPPSGPTCTPMVAVILFLDVTVSDPTFPGNNFVATGFPVTKQGTFDNWLATPGPGGASTIRLTITASADDGDCEFPKNMMPYFTQETFPKYTPGLCYDSGPQPLFNFMSQPSGSVRAYS